MLNDSPVTASPANFVEDGFVILREAVRPELMHKLQQIALAALGHPSVDGLNEAELFEGFNQTVLREYEQGGRPFDILKPVWRNLIHENLVQEVFLEPPVYGCLSRLLGCDIAYQDDPQLTLNLPGIGDSRRNYLFKGFHQEFWSGASSSSVQFWMPIFQHDARAGQISVVPGSHTWGHIPHRNREPVELPADYSEVETDLQVGDVIVFHTLLLHRSVPLASDGRARLAMPGLLRNFRQQFDSFERYKNWRILSYSDLSLVDRKLGNHHLSPFRLVDLETHSYTGDVR